MRATRHTRPLPRADMTPLVNIALLLIVFFVWVKQAQQPVVTTVNPLIKGKYESYEPVSAILFLLDRDRIGFLTYPPNETSAVLREVDYSIGGLRTHLAATTKSTRQPIVLVIPTPLSTVKNLVDVLDELTINKQVRFLMGYGLSRGENQMLSDYQRYRQTNPQRPCFMRVDRDHCWPMLQ